METSKSIFQYDLVFYFQRPKEGSRKSNLESWFSNMSLPFNTYARCTSVIKVIA